MRGYLSTAGRLMVLLVFLAGLPACRGIGQSQLEPVQIALPILEQNALIYIAEDRGFFQQNGLEVIIQHFDTGVAALEAMQDSEVNLAVSSEFPVVRSLLNNDPLLVIASIDKFENDFIVARKDRGITQVADLKGKRVGVALRSINEFFLARFLELNGLQPGDVTPVDLKPDEFVEALAGGRVDALIAWQPYIHQVEKEIREVVVWPAQSSQSVYGLLVARKDWLAENPRTAEGFLLSLLQAEDFLARKPDAAKQIVQKRLSYDTVYIDGIWQHHEFTLTLDNSLIVAMNDEARWLIRNDLATQASAPEFYNAIYLDGLDALKPEAVTIDR